MIHHHDDRGFHDDVYPECDIKEAHEHTGTIMDHSFPAVVEAPSPVASAHDLLKRFLKSG